MFPSGTNSEAEPVDVGTVVMTGAIGTMSKRPVRRSLALLLFVATIVHDRHACPWYRGAAFAASGMSPTRQAVIRPSR
jgi:hypothetical protein